MAERHLVFSFGRMNPPHAGHLKLADAGRNHAKKIGGDHAIYLSQTHDGKKNPLPPDKKHKFAKKVLKGHNVVSHPEVTSMFHAAAHAAKNGYHHATLVVGSDRHEEMSKKAEALKKHSGLKSVSVVSAGHRDPDSHDPTERASGTETRRRAKTGLTSFKTMLPKHVSHADAEEMHSTLSSHMESLDWFNHQEFEEFMNNSELLMEAAKYLPPDLYLVQGRRGGEVKVVVRPDPVGDTVLKGGPDKPKPTMTDIEGAIRQQKFKQTPTSMEVFGDLSDMMKDVESQRDTEKAAEKRKKDAEETAPSGEDAEQMQQDAEAQAQAQAQAEYDALDPFTPAGPAQNIDTVQYPGPSKEITQGRGVQFEWAVTYLAAKAAGATDEQLAKRNEMAGENLTAFRKDVFDMAKQAVRHIPDECRGQLKHSDEVGISGRPEPKTDLLCGDNKISLKMNGNIQLSSESAQTTAKTLENLSAIVGSQDQDVMQNAVKNVSKALKSLPNKMIDPKNLEEARDRHAGKPWFEEMFEKNGELKDKYNWQKYSGTVTKNIQDEFVKFLSESEVFKRELVHEALTGRRAFEDNPDAAATHLLSPAGFEEIGESDGDYISSIMPKTYVGIRAKSRGRITQPTFRFELKGNNIELVEANKPKVKMDGDTAFIYTPELLGDFYSKNPEQILREISRKLNISVSGNLIEDAPEEGRMNILNINGKEKKIPVLPEKPDPEDSFYTEEEDDINESFSIILEKKKKRNYKREYRNFHGKPEQRKRRSQRVLARRKLEKQGRVRRGDGKDVDHKRPLRHGGSNDGSNLRVQPKSQNRSNNGHFVGEEHGAGFEGTDKLLNTYIEGTPGQKKQHIVSKRKN